MKRLIIALALGLAGAGSTVQAVETPSGSPADFRIKHVAYDADNVVRLDAVIGIATHIILEPGEGYVTHAFGDPNGWEFAHKDHHYFIKAKAAKSDTNLVLVTNKRNYNFILHFIGTYETRATDGKQTAHEIQTPWSLRNATLQVAFTYPETDSEATRLAALARRFDDPSAHNNLNYTMSATPDDKDIAPINVWDDGRFTYFKFTPHTDLPNLYTVSADGSEAIVNRHMLDEPGSRVIVAEKIAAKFRLRLGDAVVGIYNESFDPNGAPNTTGTASPSVHRVIKGMPDE